jgi:hypothetical protein
LVGEGINGGIRQLVIELGRGIRERRIRQRGWDLEDAFLFFFFHGKTLGEGGRGEETGSQNLCGDIYYDIGVSKILGSGARKYDFLELGSQRGSVPSWLGGNNFRQF